MLLALLGCGGTNALQVHHPELMPFELGKIKSAVWGELPYSEPDRGDGAAWMFLTTSVVTCAEIGAMFGEDYSYAIWDESSAFNTNAGLVLLAYWHSDEDADAGFEGTYPTYGYVESDEGKLEREGQLLLFDHGRFVLSATARGFAEVEEVSGAEVKGEIDTELLDVDFKAENCGRWGDAR